MVRKRSRVDGLKLPFVVTVTMAAGACGGTVTTRDGNGIGEGSGGQGGGDNTATGGRRQDTGPRISSGGSVNPPLPGICPSTVPPSGGLCSDPTSCSYPGATPCELGYSAQCIADDGAPPGASPRSGHWSITTAASGGCNPPFPITTCPVTEPLNGSYCSYQGPPCSYNNFQCPFPDTEALCTGNQWTVNHAYCDPPWPSDGSVDSGVGVIVDAGPAGD